jgi:hypothetical protein
MAEVNPASPVREDEIPVEFGNTKNATESIEEQSVQSGEKDLLSSEMADEVLAAKMRLVNNVGCIPDKNQSPVKHPAISY